MDSPSRRSWVPRPLPMVVVLVVGTALAAAGWAYSYARNRLAAIDYVRNGGGSVKLDGEPDWWPESAPIPFPKWLQDCDAVQLDSKRCDLRRVAPLHEIRRILMSGSDFRGVESFPNLVSLNAMHATTTDAGLEPLRSCRSLRDFQIGSRHITDDGLQALAGLPLVRLNLANASITDAGLPVIAKLRLNGLGLNGTGITDAGLRHLARTPLEDLWLDRTNVTDAGMEAISHHSLRFLSIRDTAVTMQGLRVLGKKKSLLVWLNHPFTREDVRELRKEGILASLYTDTGIYQAD